MMWFKNRKNNFPLHALNWKSDLFFKSDIWCLVCPKQLDFNINVHADYRFTCLIGKPGYQ